MKTRYAICAVISIFLAAIACDDNQKQIRFDLVFLDAYSGEGLPGALSSPAFFDDVKAKVTDGGVVILNLFNLNGREQSLLDVFETRFAHTACIRTADDLNLVVFGKSAAMPSRADLTGAVRRFTEVSKLSFDVGIIAEDLNLDCTVLARTNPP